MPTSYRPFTPTVEYEVPVEQAQLLLLEYLEGQGTTMPGSFQYPILLETLITPSRGSRSTASMQLERLTAQQFQTLMTDVHNEIVRRDRIRPRKIPYTATLSEIDPLRQICRRRLSSIVDVRLSDLVLDLLSEMSRRGHSLKHIMFAYENSSFKSQSTGRSNASSRKAMLSGMFSSQLESFTTDSRLCLDGQISHRSEFPVASGGYSDIYQGLWKGQVAAIKVMRPFGSTGQRLHRDKIVKRLWREFLSWSSLYHPNITLCLGFSYDFSQGQDVPSLISPWMSNGTVLGYLDNCPDVSSRLKLIEQIAHGLFYLHRERPPIVHGDLRAGNVLVSDGGVPCLTDFGLAKILSDTPGFTTTSELAGSMRWQSPEILRGETLTVTRSSDVWAFGMTALEILTKTRPYAETKMDSVVFGQIIGGELPLRPSDSFGITDEIWAILHQCWTSPASKRASMFEILNFIHRRGP